MLTLRTDILIALLSIAVMLAVRFWASLAGAELLGLVTLLRIIVGAAILGAVVGVWSERIRSGIALAIGVTIATVIATIFTRGGFDPEAAAGASLIAVVVSLASFGASRRVMTWVRIQGGVVQGLLVVIGIALAIGLVVAVGTAN